MPRTWAERGGNRDWALAIVAAVLTAAFLVALASNVAPWLRGPKAWRWAYAIPGTLARLWLPALLLLAYVFFAAWLHRQAISHRTVALAMLASVLMTPTIQLALLYMDHSDVRSQLFYRTVSEGANGFFNVGAVVMDRYDFIRYYADRMLNWYPTHVERHPPGLPVLFSLTRTFFDAHPVLTEKLNVIYRPYQCHNVPLMNLPDGAIASATLQMALPFLMSLVVPPLYWLGRAVYDKATGVRAALLWPLIPGVALWAAYWTPFYAFFTVSAWLLSHYGLSQHRLPWFYLSGLVISSSLLLSFGNSAIVGFLGIYALVWLMTTSPRPNWRWLVGAALLFAAGGATLWVWLWYRYRLSFFDVWRTGIGRHLEMARVGWFWIGYHLYDFFVAAASIPILVFWAGRTWQAFRGWFSRTRRAERLTLAFFLGLLLFDLSGAARGEVARVWAFLLPLPLLIAVSHLSRRRVAFPILAASLAAQLFLTNIYVRYIGTDLTDPPLPPPAPQRPDAGWLARWEEGIVLQSAQVPESVSEGDPLTVRTTWMATEPGHRPYTVFLHMYDDGGDIVAQRDVMPLKGRWPTTCWRSGQAFEDSYTLIPLQPVQAGTYRLRLGLYWLPTGERLSLRGQSLEGDRVVELGTLQVRAPSGQ